MNKSKLLAIAGIWIAATLLLFGVYQIIFAPMMAKKKAEQVQEEKKQILTNTGSSSRYQYHIRIGTDSFSGYSILRSEGFEKHCGAEGIQAEVIDVPDYQKRLAALRSGEIHMAAFSADSLIKTSATLGELPATIVAMIDESAGADSAWASKQFSSLDALNDPSTKFVLVGDSPSETFVQVIRQDFELNRLSADPFIRVGSAQEVLAAYRQSRPGEKKVFVTWQPEASQIGANNDYKEMINSARLRGYIVDVLVVSRDFLAKNEEIVRKIVQAYFHANYDLSDKTKLVQSDASKTGGTLTTERAKDVAGGIRWRNTQENYAHFGMVQQPGYQHIEDILGNITRILVNSGSIKADPTGGKLNLLYYDKILREMFSSGFHPGNENVQAETNVAVLDDDHWKSLIPVGTMQVPPINFARGTARISTSGEETMTDLVTKLKTWPQYYLVVRGHAKGSSPEDLDVQKRRAEAAVEWLVAHGVNGNRIRSEPSESNGSATVKFQLGQLPY